MQTLSIVPRVGTTGAAVDMGVLIAQHTVSPTLVAAAAPRPPPRPSPSPIGHRDRPPGLQPGPGHRWTQMHVLKISKNDQKLWLNSAMSDAGSASCTRPSTAEGSRSKKCGVSVRVRTHELQCARKFFAKMHARNVNKGCVGSPAAAAGVAGRQKSASRPGKSGRTAPAVGSRRVPTNSSELSIRVP